MKDAFIVSALSLVPKNAATRMLGHVNRLSLPRFLHRMLLRWYIGHYGVDLSECVGGADDYASLADFFVRPLKPGMRTIDPRPEVLVSPVDAKVHTFGKIEAGSFLQYDGKRSSVALLLGAGDPRLPGVQADLAARYEGGQFAVLYLSPKDYHRVHTPEAGVVRRLRYLPGKLWPVFPAATRKVDDVFSRNERLVFELETERFGLVTEVMVGAFGVGRMTTVVDPLITNQGLPAVEKALSPAPALGRAAELGRFEMGSTVILLLEPGKGEWTLQIGAPVRLGQPIARRV